MKDSEVKENIGEKIKDISKEYYPTNKYSIEEETDFDNKNLGVEFVIYKDGYRVQLNSGYETGYSVLGMQKDYFDVYHPITEEEILDVIERLRSHLTMVKYTVDELGMIDLSYLANDEDKEDLPFHCIEIKFTYTPQYFSIDLSWINELLKRKYSNAIIETEEYYDNSKRNINAMNREQLIDTLSSLDDDTLRELLIGVQQKNKVRVRY